jgi:hypothetical protein
MKVPTVTIDRGGVAVVINESDFDPATDKLSGGGEVDESGDLIAQLAELGIKKDRRSSVERLRAELNKALEA